MQPKWWLETKRGWGMLITAVMGLITYAGPLLSQWTGIPIDAAFVGLVGQVVANLLEAIGFCIGFYLWVVGSFRPTAPITVTKPV